MKHSAIFIAFFTTLVQCYDYALFGLSAATLSTVFMPNSENTDQLQGFFALFSAAVLIKPIGAVIFGRIGDKYGRATSVKIAAFMAALSTFCIGLTPGFGYIGWWATGILALCRMIFIISLTGEIDATRIYVSEKMASNKNFANGILSFCNQSGAFFAAISYHLAANSNIANIWRINFIIGGILGIVILLFRHHFQESEEFLKYKANRHPNLSEESLRKIISTHKNKFIIALIISGCGGGIYHFLIIFSGTFSLKILEIITKDQAQLLSITLVAIYSIAALISGWIADKINPFRQITISTIVSLVLSAMIQFILVDRSILAFAVCILVFMMPFYTVPLHILIQSLFAVNIRVRMCSLSHAIGGMILSSTTPFVSMLIWKQTNSLNLVFGYFIFLITMLIISIQYLKVLIKN
ncbi:MAG: MFS transporter [Rickettsiaceae bacterium]|nr:MAG: MFS transporter [Rickettsiaceae bacterium]